MRVPVKKCATERVVSAQEYAATGQAETQREPGLILPRSDELLARRVASGGERAFRALSRFDALIEVAHPERGFRELFHIAGLERTDGVGLAEQREPPLPIAGGDCSTPTVDDLAHAPSLP